jgi:hypothetical protein
MVSAIKQRVTVQPAGVIEVRSPELQPGTQAEVIVLVETAGATDEQPRGDAPAPRGWRSYAGVLNSGDPHSADNDRIDAELAHALGGQTNEREPVALSSSENSASLDSKPNELGLLKPPSR